MWNTCDCGSRQGEYHDFYDDGQPGGNEAARWHGHEPNDWGIGLDNVDEFDFQPVDLVLEVDGPNDEVYNLGPVPDQEPIDPAIEYFELRRHAEVLRAQTDCEEHDFLHHDGQATCDVCRWRTPYFHFQCSHCMMQSCRACRGYDVRAVPQNERRRERAVMRTEEVIGEVGEIFEGMLEHQEDALKANTDDLIGNEDLNSQLSVEHVRPENDEINSGGWEEEPSTRPVVGDTD